MDPVTAIRTAAAPGGGGGGDAGFHATGWGRAEPTKPPDGGRTT